MSSGNAKWLVMAWVSTARRSVRRPFSRSDSQTVLFHSIFVAPQMSFTRMWSPRCSLRCGRPAPDLFRNELVDLDRDALAAGLVDQVRVSSIVSGRFISDRSDPLVRPVT